MKKNSNVMMLIYDLIEYNDNYSGTTGSLWQYQKDNSKTSIIILIYLNLKEDS